MRKINCWLCLLLLHGFLTLPCFGKLHGKLLVQNYDLVEIGSASGSFWATVKDKRGVLYFGGEHAVFEFDGTTWRSIEIPNKSVVRSLCKDDNGTIFVGGVNEFGYLASDESGNLNYVSLIDKIPDNKLDFPDIWSVNTIGSTVYFQSADRLFVYKNKEIKTIELKNSYHRSFVVNSVLYFNQEKTGLCYLEDESIRILPEGEFFREKLISSLSVFEVGKLLIGTRRNGLFIYDPSAPSGKKISPFKSEASQFLIDNQLYHGIELPGNKFAFASLQNGAIIMNKQGEILDYINKHTGSSDYSTYFLCLSNETELWITSGRGISLYNTNSSINYWNEEMGLVGAANSVIEYENKIYVGTNNGLFSLNDNEKKVLNDFQPTEFEQLHFLNSEVWQFLIFNPEGQAGTRNNDQLLAATGHGLYNIDKHKLEFKSDRVGKVTISHSRINPSIIYLNSHPFFYVLQYQNGEWQTIWEKQISSYVISVVEDKEGNVWLGTMYYGIFKIGLDEIFRNPDNRISSRIPLSSFTDIIIENYDTSDGLPDLTMAKTHFFHNQLIITCKGIYTYDSKENKIVKARNFGENIEEWNRTMEGFEEDIYGNIWGINNEILDKQADGRYHVVSLPYRMLTIRNSTQSYYHDSKGSTWIGGEQVLLRYDSKIAQPVNRTNFSTLIRRVTLPGDSIIFGGTYARGDYDSPTMVGGQPESRIPSIEFYSRSISFEYSCPYFQDDIPLEYSYILEGFDEDWSDWSSSTFKEYNNLRERNYCFRVKARNYSGENSQEAIFRFIITPPWQRTILAYILFSLSIAAFIFFGIKAYVKRLKQSNIHLEKVVRERTHELEMQKEEVNNQASKLKSQNDKLTHQRNRMSEMSKEILRTNRDKLKFFTNISHELRTPLTLILGPIEELHKENEVLTKEERISKYDIVIKNARRLLTLVNQILDFRKIEISMPKLAASEGEIVAFTNDLSSCFRGLAKMKNIDLIFSSAETKIVTWYDADKIGKILFNLISNAFKFTDEGGKVSIRIELVPKKDSVKNDEKVVRIIVSDTGIGMDEDMLPKIFDRYYHNSKSMTLEQAGSGIGLSMAASLAEIHQGKIEVESEIEKGSRFTLIIPFGESYLKETEKETSTVQNVLQTINEKAKIEIINHLHESTIKRKNIVDKNSDKELILIVEDSEDIRSYIISEIEKKYDFIEAEDGEEGYELALKYNPKVIICDVIMPKMDGFEFCSKVKSTIEISHIPLILLTSKSSDEDIGLGLQIGADAYISKPFNLKLLVARVDNLILSSDRLKERFSKNLTYNSSDIFITSTDEKFIEKALKTVEANMANPEFGVDMFAKEMAMSQSTLYRKLKALSGESTNDFIKDLRLKKAANILLKNDLQVNEVSMMVGFDDPAYFAKNFKHKFGKSPSEYSRNKKE